MRKFWFVLSFILLSGIVLTVRLDWGETDPVFATLEERYKPVLNYKDMYLGSSTESADSGTTSYLNLRFEGCDFKGKENLNEFSFIGEEVAILIYEHTEDPERFDMISIGFFAREGEDIEIVEGLKVDRLEYSYPVKGLKHKSEKQQGTAL